MNDTPLTDRQSEIFAFICRYWVKHLRSPSLREISDAFNFVGPNAAMCHVTALEKKGRIKRHSKKRDGESSSRGITVVGMKIIMPSSDAHPSEASPEEVNA